MLFALSFINNWFSGNANVMLLSEQKEITINLNQHGKTMHTFWTTFSTLFPSVGK